MQFANQSKFISHLFAGNSIAVTIKSVYVRPNHTERSANIIRAVSTASGTINVTNDRNTGTNVRRVTSIRVSKSCRKQNERNN